MFFFFRLDTKKKNQKERDWRSRARTDYLLLLTCFLRYFLYFCKWDCHLLQNLPN